ncbi:MAG: hypothetical protein ACI9A2_004288 [Halioglobus sp.]|jgi:hypothetical protein
MLCVESIVEHLGDACVSRANRNVVTVKIGNNCYSL